MIKPESFDDLAVNMIELMDIVARVLGQPWVDAINKLNISDGRTACFDEAPAGKGQHHAYAGGLVVHLLEMWNFWLLLKPSFSASKIINDKTVLAGILAHDLHKANKMYVVSDEGVTYAETGEACLVSAAQANVALIPAEERGNLLLLNIISHAEGGWAKDPAKWATSLSKLVYVLDELSANVLARVEENCEFGIKAKGFSL